MFCTPGASVSEATLRLSADEGRTIRSLGCLALGESFDMVLQHAPMYHLTSTRYRLSIKLERLEQRNRRTHEPALQGLAIAVLVIEFLPSGGDTGASMGFLGV